MGRRNRRREDEPKGRNPEAYKGNETVEVDGDGEWIVRELRGSSSTKPYRCPGCDQVIPTATPHIVAWLAHDSDAEHRRHWHKSCWRSRAHRKPRRGA